MDFLVATRGYIRGAVTNTCKKINDAVTANDEPAARQSMAILEDKSQQLDSDDNAIRQLMATDFDKYKGDLEKEIESVQKYRELIVQTRSAYQDFISNRLNACTVDEDIRNLSLERRNSLESASNASSTKKKRYKLPKLQITKFDGDPKKWLSFKGGFDRVKDDPELEDFDKLQYLITYTVEGSPARDVVECFPMKGESFQPAYDELEERFADFDSLISIYVAALHNTVMNQRSPQTRQPLPILYKQLKTHISALETLDYTLDKYAAFIKPLVEAALPENTLRAWQRHREDKAEFSQTPQQTKQTSQEALTSLMLYLAREVKGEEKIMEAKAVFGDQSYVSKTRQDTAPATAAALVSTNQASNGPAVLSCFFCDKGNHPPPDCLRAQTMSYEDKKSMLDKKSACHVCLRSISGAKHQRNCRFPVRCLICQKRHYTIMCPEAKQVVKSSNPARGSESGRGKNNRPSTDPPPTNSVLAQARGSDGTCTVYQQTVRLKVRSPSGKFRIVRAFLDTGCERSYVSTRLVRDLNLNPIAQERFSHGLFGGEVTQLKDFKRYEVHLISLTSDYECVLNALQQNTICGPVRPVPPSVLRQFSNAVSFPEGTSLDGPIDVLLGIDIYGSLLTGRLEQASGLTATETYFSWTCAGTHDNNESHGQTLIAQCLVSQRLPDLWQLDVLGIRDPFLPPTESELHQDMIRHFKETIRRDDDGRYIVGLPWKPGHPELVSNFFVARQRLQFTSNQLKRRKLYDDYAAVFDDWRAQNIIEEIQSPIEKDRNRGYYLPHRAVVKLSSATTKIRPVFDASARTQSSPSLNDCLSIGPNLLEQIPHILIGFRLHQFGVIADIKQAFLQIGLRQEDRDFLRFLWGEHDGAQEPRFFRHCRVVFGVNSSPFLLNATLHFHFSHQTNAELHWTLDILKRQLYVDNLAASVSSTQELAKLHSESRTILAAAKFDLRGWASNARSQIYDNPDPLQSVLGLRWDCNAETLACDFDIDASVYSQPVTKRLLLSVAQRVFDPIGFTAPVTIMPKILLQKAWEADLKWDQALPQDLSSQFTAWCRQLPQLLECKIPRWIAGVNPSPEVTTELHAFSDASETAYGACIFLRSSTATVTNVQLVLAKARVTPLKLYAELNQTTSEKDVATNDKDLPPSEPPPSKDRHKAAKIIHRLELLAALVSVRLCNTVQNALDNAELRVFYWCDSTTALSWIRRNEPWATFVGNRVKEIRASTKAEQWRYVPTDMNPADLPSRGCTPSQLLQSQWWNGPVWLRGPESSWPNAEARVNLADVLAEKRKTPVAHLVALPDNSTITALCQRISSFQKIVRVLSWIRRYISCLKQRVQAKIRLKLPPRIILTKDKLSGVISSVSLTTDEILQAEVSLFKGHQQQYLTEDAKKRFTNHTLITDENGLIRIESALIMGNYPAAFTTPIVILDGILAERIIYDLHRSNSHAGTSIVLSLLRERFYIPRARKLVRNLLTKCLKCRRFSARPVQTMAAPLPPERINQACAFQTTGVDLAGPLILYDGSKAYIALFTCAVYRAIHLELLSDLSTNVFLLGLRRFLARRGRPHDVHSDNGTNFQGTQTLFQALDWKKLLEDGCMRRIKWHFNPPASPWWGGWWERMVGLTKELLRKNLGAARLNYEEMNTILCDCEAILNSRPLTYISDDAELRPLTPSHFIQDITETSTVDLDTIDATNLKCRFKYLQTLRNGIRSRFYKEYLAELIARGRSPAKGPIRQLQVGDVVLVQQDNKKRLQWPLARIEEIYLGRDGESRVAKVKTAKGYLTRPFQRLYPLEMETETGKELVLQHDKNLQVPEVKSETAATPLPSPSPPPVPESDSSPTPIPVVTNRRGRQIKAPTKLNLVSTTVRD